LRKNCFIALAMILLSGCAGTASMSGWRDDVEKYVNDFGNGDPNSLRDVTWPQSRHQFSKLGADEPEHAQDAKGVLLAYRVIEGKPWFIFVVATVNNQLVQDIRVEAMNLQTSEFSWQESAANPTSLQQYRDYYDRLWKRLFPDRATAPAQYTTFPHEGELFDVQINAAKVTVTQRPSGASWEVVIGQQPANRD